MGGGPESRCVGRVCGLGGAVRHPSTKSVQRIVCRNLTSSAPDDGRMRPKHVELRIHQYITLLHQVDISRYFMMKMHGQTTLKGRQKMSHSLGC